ncbi:hypothetical protein FS320_24265 [Microvirga tunisiensis]|uniref:Uncharacterized protein n=1 Tax=Microvirga tunisiensis TaxID=2108360 RepID=A0A5N7MMB5_9HYPH|nr:hypothetical protein [Microvirga tunisiensis]MPR28192.1 hypothetical protein [Microvirga tunisiensis]
MIIFRPAAEPAFRRNAYAFSDPPPSCLVAERCWDRVRYAIEEYTWRFDGLRRRASHRRRT